ncbi:hypothetical protein D3C72_255010 [compost metagenome]
MAYIDDTQKLDLLWKKLQYGVSFTDPSKTAYEELTRSHDQLRATDIWQQDNLIPATAGSVPGVVEFVDIRCRPEPSVTDNTAWVAVNVYATGITVENRLRDFIHPKFDPSYEIRVYADSAKTKRIFNSADETNWVFDYSSGILWFPTIDVDDPITEVYILGYRYIGPKGLNPTFSGTVIDVLGDVTGGDFSGGYVPGFVENETKIADAVDQINRALLDFVPKAPITLAELLIEMPGAVSVIDDANVVLSEGAIDNTNIIGFKPAPGNTVERVAGINLETTYVGPFGDGKQGTLSVELNNTSVGLVNLTDGDNSGIYGKLDLNQDVSNAGTNTSFFETLTARAVALDLPLGLNALNLTHSVTGSTNTLWLVRDSITTKPVINWTNAVETPSVDIVYSSGVPHYARGSQILFSASVSGLATDIHLDTKNVEFQTVPKMAGPNVWAYPGSYGLPAVLEKNQPYTANNIVFTIADYQGNVGHGTVTVKTIARNANGKTELTGTQKINYMRGGQPTGISPVDEAGIPVSNLGTYEAGFSLYATRVELPANVNPAVDVGALLPWDSAGVLADHEAAVVGGAITWTKENYSTTYLPSGPDYSGKADTQYATFMIQRKHVNLLNIEIEGRYSGLWVKLPGLLDQSKISNGWMDCTKNYEGWGVPGREVLGGCAVGLAAFGGSQTVTATFGYESSSVSTNNLILVRFRLNAGDSITGLRFSGVAR